MKNFLGDRICDDLEEVCEEVKRQLRQGNKVEVYRYTGTPASFVVAFYQDRIPSATVVGKKYYPVTGYFQEG